MDFGIRGRRALVTGGGRGLGRSIAQCLAREGAKVAVASRTRRDIDSLVAEMGGSTEGHYGLTADLTEQGATTRVAQLVERDFGPLDIVVHNLGGTLDITTPLCPIDDWRKVWRFNLEIAIELNLIVIPGMQQRKWGRIIHISSISSMENHGPIPYCSVKAALTAYARSMGRVLAPDGIVISAVLPGAIFTENGYWDTVSREQPEHVKKYLAERMAIRRFGKPDEIGEAVAFLCSTHASFFTGSVVPIDGGQGRSYFGQ